MLVRAASARLGLRRFASARPAVTKIQENSFLEATSEDVLTDEDIYHFQSVSAQIMADPKADITREEARGYLRRLDFKQRAAFLFGLPGGVFFHRLHWMALRQVYGRANATVRLGRLTMERMENKDLLRAFALNRNYNHQLYWMALHAWIIHQRFLLERDAKLEDEYFEVLWKTVCIWMDVKKIPSYRSFSELRHSADFFYGFCTSMDRGLERSDILAGRLLRSVWANVFSGEVSVRDKRLPLLTKYVMRQLALVMNMPKEHFLTGSFVWADFKVPKEFYVEDEHEWMRQQAHSMRRRGQWRDPQGQPPTHAYRREAEG